VKVGAEEVTKYYSKLMKADPSGNDQVMILHEFDKYCNCGVLSCIVISTFCAEILN